MFQEQFDQAREKYSTLNHSKKILPLVHCKTCNELYYLFAIETDYLTIVSAAALLSGNSPRERCYSEKDLITFTPGPFDATDLFAHAFFENILQQIITNRPRTFSYAEVPSLKKDVKNWIVTLKS